MGYCGRGYNYQGQSVDTLCCSTCGGGSPPPPPPPPSDSGSSSGCTADHSLGQCDKCLTGVQCPNGYYCCPYMKRCVASSSMGCQTPIANCRPMCYDSNLATNFANCNCQQDLA